MKMVGIVLSVCLISNSVLAENDQLSEKVNINEQNLFGYVELENVIQEQNLTVKGKFGAKNSTFRALQTFGQAELEKCSIEGQLTAHGSTELDSVHVNGAVKIYGHTELEKSKFEQAIDVQGASEIEDSNFKGAVTLKGKSELKDSTFEQSVIVHGVMYAEGVQFKNKLTINAHEATLTDSVVEGTITINKSDQEFESLTLVNTSVKGDIIFISRQGKIQMDNKSVVKGKIQGAKIYQK